MRMIPFLANLAVAGLCVSSVVNAQHALSHGHAHSATDMVEGEVQQVDKAARNITLRHSEIKNMQMPAMTMTFHVKEPALLDNVKTGDRVKFKVEAVGGVPTVTAIAPFK